jgi:hypothetical protein
MAIVAAACTGCSAPADPVARGDAAEKVRAAIAEPAGLDTFPTEPLPGDGRVLCVGREEIRLYVFDSDAERADAAALIDPSDPSHVGNAVVSWSGNPAFWEVGRALVLYLGPDEELFEELVEAFGEPYAAGPGRTGGLDVSC